MAARFPLTGQTGQQQMSLARAFSPRGGGPLRGPKSDEVLAQQSMPGWLWGSPHRVAAEQTPIIRDVSPLRFHGVRNGPAVRGEGALQPLREGSPFQRDASPQLRKLPLQQLPTVHQASQVSRCLRDAPMGLPVECEGPLVHESSQESQRTRRATSPVRTEPNRLQSTLLRPTLQCRGDVALQAMGCEATPVGTSSSGASMQPPLQQTTRQAQHELTNSSSFQIRVPGLPREGKLGLVLRGTSIIAVNTSWAAQLGFAPGQRLLAINGSPVSDYQDLSRVISFCLAAGPATFDLGVPQPASVGTPPASSFHQSTLTKVQLPSHAFQQTPLLCPPAAAVRNSSPTRRPSLPNPDEMLQQVLSAATAGACLPLPRSDMQRQQCKSMPRAFSPTRQEPQDLVPQSISDPNSCVSSMVIPRAHTGSTSIEPSSMTFSACSAKGNAEVGGLGLSSFVATSLPTPTGEATQTTPTLNRGARLLAGAAADCLPNVGSMEDPTGDLPSSSTEVPNKERWRFALASPSEAGLAGKATGQHNKALDAQLEVARMAEQAHQDGWLPEQAQQHVAWMAEQTTLDGPLEAAI